MEVGIVVVLVVVPRILRLQPPGPEVSLGVGGQEPASAHQVEVTRAGHEVTLLPAASLVVMVAVLSVVQVWQAAPPGPLAGLLEQPHLVLVLLAVVLHVFPQAAGVRVLLLTARHLTLVRLLTFNMVLVFRVCWLGKSLSTYRVLVSLLVFSAV